MNSDLSITIGAKPEAMKLSNVKSGFEFVELAYEFEIHKPLFSLRCLTTSRLKREFIR